MATATDPALTLAQWFSPAYPVGGFHFSHGLETAIADGAVADRVSLSDWVETVLSHGAGRNDALLLAAAAKADAPALDALDATARALAATSERLTETVEMGTAFARVTSALLQTDLPARAYPVAVGEAVARAGLPPVLAVQFYLQAMLSNLASVAMRLIPLGQTDGQQVIRALTPLCSRIAEDTAEGDLTQLAASAFLAEIAAMRHETLNTRICRT